MAKGGNVVVFTARSGSHPTFDDATIDRVSLADGARETLLVGGSHARLLPSGVLVFFRGGDLQAVKVDAETLRPIGETVSVLEGVMSDPSTGAAQYSISETGMLVYVEGDEWLPRRLLTLVDGAGTTEPLPTEGRPFRSPRLSPDGSRLAVVIEAANDDIWTYTLSDMAAQRVTFAAGSNVAPLWSPDGSRIAFASNRFGVYNIFVKAADLSGEAIRLTTSGEIQFPSSWHPDGSVIAFTQSSSGTANGIWMVPTDGGETRAFLDAPYNEYGGVFSPDGRWIAYVSDEDGEDQIFVQRYPDRGSKRQISIDGGTDPHWSEDGSRLFYRSGREIMSVRIDGDSDFRPGTPELALRWPDNATTGLAAVPNFDLRSSGSNFLIVEEAQIQSPRRIHAVRGWMEEVLALVGR
jgi:Tol biopolymer transport system component